MFLVQLTKIDAAGNEKAGWLYKECKELKFF